MLRSPERTLISYKRKNPETMAMQNTIIGIIADHGRYADFDFKVR
jgi:hypothetical protein